MNVNYAKEGSVLNKSKQIKNTLKFSHSVLQSHILFLYQSILKSIYCTNLIRPVFLTRVRFLPTSLVNQPSQWQRSHPVLQTKQQYIVFNHLMYVLLDRIQTTLKKLDI